MTNFEKIKSFDFTSMLNFLCEGANVCEDCRHRFEYQCGENLSNCREATSNWLSREISEK